MGFGIHSKFSALMANARLLTKRVSKEKSLQGTPRALWFCALTSAHPSPRTDAAHLESPRDPTFCRASMSVTLFVNTHETRT